MQFAATRLSMGAQRPPSCLLLRGAWRCSAGAVPHAGPPRRDASAPAGSASAASAASLSSAACPSSRSSSSGSASSNSSSSSKPPRSGRSSSSGLRVSPRATHHDRPPAPPSASAAAAAAAPAASAHATENGSSSEDGSTTKNSNGSTTTTTKWGVYGSLPPPPKSLPAWDAARFGSGASPALDPRRRIYCNRSLNMAGVSAVGFDLDYTLASYRPETFEALAHAQTVDKLVACFGYPARLKELGFEWRYMTRGLIMDKKRGNVLKVDRHKYVKVAYHGFRPLSRDERSAVYNASPVRAEGEGFDEPRYGAVDTLFSLAEAYLFMQLVELVDADPLALRDANPEAAAAGKGAQGGYAALYRDVRAAVDLCHRDGSLKREVARAPERYIHADPHLVPMLRMLKRSGRRVFLATNSLWDYTHVVMNHLVGDGSLEGDKKEAGAGAGRGGEDDDDDDAYDGGGGESDGAPSPFATLSSSSASSSASALENDGASSDSSSTATTTNKRRKRTTDWLRLFDVVVVGCAKPGFFSERRPLFAVNPRDGTLRNTDNGAPITPIGEDEDPSGATAERSASAGAAAAAAARCASAPDDAEALVFQGGNYTDLHRLLGVKSGAEVLYVGDHIYGDILRSKKTLGWRTMLVAPELEAELARLRETAAVQRELRLLRAARAELDDRVQRLEWAFKNGEVAALASSQAEAANAAALADLKAQRDGVRRQHGALLRQHHESFHPVWGQLLKTGYQNSRFAHQVDRFACLYSAHAANLAFYSPEASHRGKSDAMDHEYFELFEGGGGSGGGNGDGNGNGGGGGFLSDGGGDGGADADEEEDEEVGGGQLFGGPGAAAAGLEGGGKGAK